MKQETIKTLKVVSLLLVLFSFCAFAVLPQPVRATNTVAATVTVGSGPEGVAITPNGNYAYVTNSGGTTVSVINTASTASPSPTVPEFPAQLLGITLVVFMVAIFSVVIITRRKQLGKSNSTSALEETVCASPTS